MCIFSTHLTINTNNAILCMVLVCLITRIHKQQGVIYIMATSMKVVVAKKVMKGTSVNPNPSKALVDAKAKKAKDLESKMELLESVKTSITAGIREAMLKIQTAESSALNASIAIGGLLAKGKDAFKDAGLKTDDFLSWADDAFGLKKAMVYNDIMLNEHEDTEEIKNASGVKDALQNVRAKKSSNKDKPAPKTPDFDYVIRRSSGVKSKPEDGSVEDIAEHIYDAIRSVIDGHKNEKGIIEELELLMNDHIVNPLTEEKTA